MKHCLLAGFLFMALGYFKKYSICAINIQSLPTLGLIENEPSIWVEKPVLYSPDRKSNKHQIEAIMKQQK
jgi:hypothetical protein